MGEPRRDHYLCPATSEDTAAALAAAIDDLAARRGFGDHSDATVHLHLLASLISQAEQLLPEAVAEVRDHGCSWAEIADLLGVTRASAWQRYAQRCEPPT